ncbi:MAG: hypothetical protein P1P64_04330 [Treponemataceae bacterium]
MTNKNKFDIDSVNDFLFYDYELKMNLALSKKFFWPCYRKTIAIKNFPLLKMNLFDFYILQFTESSGNKSEKLAEVSGLDADLVDFLQQRLNHKGLLDEFYYLTEEGKTFLKKERENIQETEIRFFYVYYDAFTCKLLPKIIPIESEKTITDFTVEGNYVKIKENASLGKQTGKEDNVWRFKFPEYNECELEMKAIQNLVIKTAKKKGFTIPSAGFSIEPCDDNLFDNIYLAVDFMLQASKTDNWIITEGFSENPSIIFENAINLGLHDKADEKKINKGRECLIQERFNIPKEESIDFTEEQKEKLLFWYLKYYKTIYQKLKALELTKNELDKLRKSNAEEDKIKQNKRSFILSIYQTLEHTLAEYAELFITEKTFDSLVNKDPDENKKAFIKQAKMLKFNLEKTIEDVFRVKWGSVKGSISDTPQLFPLVVLNVLQTIDNSSHAFRDLAQKLPNVLLHFYELKTKRDVIEHDNTARVDLNDNQFDYYYKICYDILYILFPEAKSYKGEKKELEKVVKIDETNIRQNEIKAEKILEKELGFAMIGKLRNDDLYSDFKIMQRAILDSSRNVINIFYNLFDKLFYRININFIDLYGETFKPSADDCLEYAKKNGFNFDKENISALKNINNERLKAALDGKKISLQASFLTFLFKANQSGSLSIIEKDCNWLVSLINEISENRKHGDTLSQDLKLVENKLTDWKYKLYFFTRCIYENNFL